MIFSSWLHNSSACGPISPHKFVMIRVSVRPRALNWFPYFSSLSRSCTVHPCGMDRGWGIGLDGATTCLHDTSTMSGPSADHLGRICPRGFGETRLGNVAQWSRLGQPFSPGSVGCLVPRCAADKFDSCCSTLRDLPWRPGAPHIGSSLAPLSLVGLGGNPTTTWLVL